MRISPVKKKVGISSLTLDLNQNEQNRLEFELGVPLIKDKSSVFEFMKLLYKQRCYYILDRETKKEGEKLKKYPKELIINRKTNPLSESEKPRFISFVGRRKRIPYKAIIILTIGIHFKVCNFQCFLSYSCQFGH